MARPPLRFLTARAAAVLLLAILAAGCDDAPRPPPADPPASRPTTKPAFVPIDFPALGPSDPTPGRAGYAVGRVLGPGGKPLDRPGVRVEVQIAGVLHATSERTVVRFDAAADGTYVRPLEPGTYSPPTARIEFPFEGSNYRLPLLPVRKPDASSTDASDGVVQDFAWRLTGLRPDARADPDSPDPWIGGCVRLDYIGLDVREQRALRPAPAGTRVAFTLTPKSPLADGTAGEPVVAERAYSAGGSGLLQPLITDLPLARWEVKGAEVFPDGRRRALLFFQTDGTWKESVEGPFLADFDRGDVLGLVAIKFTRQEN